MGALLKDIWRAFNTDKVMRLASAIAFCAIFSLAPLLIVLIAIAGWFLGLQNGGHGHHVAEDALLAQIGRGAGPATADAVRDLVTASFNKPRQGMIAQVIGWIAFLAGATALFSALQDSLNAIWHVEATNGGWRSMVRDRVASFGMILVIGALLLLTLVANAGIAFASEHFTGALPFLQDKAIAGAAGFVVSLFILFVAFALIYKVLPDVDLAWRDVWAGAAVTAVLFTVGEALISVYLSVAGVASAYGAAGSLLAGLLWIYYSAVVVLIGAEFTKVNAGPAATVAPAKVRVLRDEPQGADPRLAGKAGR